ncbi:hypothetical protein HHL28_15710 [Aerophototrophica crusticola]|uniref:Uncharacterized protein n=1 Tax=Aerophototrophica crusticola TaxID=1709002 RepID=A0A858RAA5_9PROT|nr:hypothetical protein HHL28_15710 [Rhodospirillaceae bacterium B3]
MGGARAAAGAGGPVECLGRRFPDEGARRDWYLARLAEKLREPGFRDQPGFPQADDATILRLSDPPWFTACPNPFLGEFVAHVGRPHDPDDVYDALSYADDVAEGKTGLSYSGEELVFIMLH